MNAITDQIDRLVSVQPPSTVQLTGDFSRCEKKSKVYDENAYTFFEKKEIYREKFDLVFLDPPYREDN